MDMQQGKMFACKDVAVLCVLRVRMGSACLFFVHFFLAASCYSRKAINLVSPCELPLDFLLPFFITTEKQICQRYNNAYFFIL